VFGKVTNQTGFVPYAGEGFALLLPSKWNPSKETDLEGLQLRSASHLHSTQQQQAANCIRQTAQPTTRSTAGGVFAPDSCIMFSN
jgi:hypothetical protein